MSTKSTLFTSTTGIGSSSIDSTNNTSTSNNNKWDDLTKEITTTTSSSSTTIITRELKRILNIYATNALLQTRTRNGGPTPGDVDHIIQLFHCPNNVINKPSIRSYLYKLKRNTNTNNNNRRICTSSSNKNENNNSLRTPTMITKNGPKSNQQQENNKKRIFIVLNKSLEKNIKQKLSSVVSLYKRGKNNNRTNVTVPLMSNQQQQQQDSKKRIFIVLNKSSNNNNTNNKKQKTSSSSSSLSSSRARITTTHQQQQQQEDGENTEVSSLECVPKVVRRLLNESAVYKLQQLRNVNHGPTIGDIQSVVDMFQCPNIVNYHTIYYQLHYLSMKQHHNNINYENHTIYPSIIATNAVNGSDSNVLVDSPPVASLPVLTANNDTRVEEVDGEEDVPEDEGEQQQQQHDVGTLALATSQVPNQLENEIHKAALNYINHGTVSTIIEDEIEKEALKLLDQKNAAGNSDINTSSIGTSNENSSDLGVPVLSVHNNTNNHGGEQHGETTQVTSLKCMTPGTSATRNTKTKEKKAAAVKGRSKAGNVNTGVVKKRPPRRKRNMNEPFLGRISPLLVIERPLLEIFHYTVGDDEISSITPKILRVLAGMLFQSAPGFDTYRHKSVNVKSTNDNDKDDDDDKGGGEGETFVPGRKWYRKFMSRNKDMVVKRYGLKVVLEKKKPLVEGSSLPLPIVQRDILTINNRVHSPIVVHEI